MTHMSKKILGGVAAAAATAAIGLAVATPANAYSGDYQFVSDVVDAGFSNPNGNYIMVGQGHGVCNAIAAGYRPIAVAHTLWLDTQLDAYGAGQFTAIAVSDLCPQFSALTYVDALTELSISNYSGPGPGTIV
jgi:hypothetical protein